MPSCSLFKRLLLLIAVAGALLSSAEAVTLDWDAVAWTPGSLSNSYDIDPARPGSDITVGVTGNTGALTTDAASGTMTPANNTSLHGGLSPAQKSLLFTTSFSNSSQSITITVTFSAEYVGGVENVSFTLFGIQKRSNIQDYVTSISALGVDGTTVYAPTITNVGSSVTHSGTDLSQTLTGSNAVSSTGSGSGAGNATISFTSSGIRSVTFTFSNATGAPNPGTQNVSLHDINFTPVPEINPALSAIGSCLMAAAVAFHHRNRVRARRK